MNRTDTEKGFGDAVAEAYQRLLVPLIFEPYAADLAGRLDPRDLSAVLEIAAGTGVLTRELAAALPESVALVATDLSESMLAQADAIGTRRPVEWRQADAARLPFGDATFDAILCQFGVMFVPDKAGAFAEARRALRPGGVFLFNVWDRIEENEFADAVMTALASVFPDDPPRFMTRIPHGYFDPPTIERDLKQGGFTGDAEIVTRAARSRADSARQAAEAYCLGTPARNEIDARDASRLEEAIAVAAAALERRFGPGPIEGKIQAHIVRIEK